MTTIYHAEIETRHFHFEAFGETEADALAALHTGLAKHGTTHKLEGGAYWWRDQAEVRLTTFTLRKCYRDREAI